MILGDEVGPSKPETALRLRRNKTKMQILLAKLD
jgi:hypothetical protein